MVKKYAIDLFAGCGGMSLGLRRAGFEVLAAVEIDKSRAKAYAKNHSSTIVFNEDIRDVGTQRMADAIASSTDQLDLIAGCPPCQGFSRIRRRNSRESVNDERNDLILVFSKLVTELKPRAVLLENVPGLELDARFAQFCADLSAAGYQYDWSLMNLADYGIPQRRRRLVLLATQGENAPSLDRIRRGPRRTVGSAIRRLPALGRSAKALHLLPQKRSDLVQRRIEAVPPDGGSRNAWPASLRLECHVRSNGFKDVYGRMSWSDVAPTITGGCTNPSKGRFLHPTAHRAISVLEASLLQTFPASYRFPIEVGRTGLSEMIGEAVPPGFARRLARYVATDLLEH